MPLKVNMVGVIPPIFASALLVLPATIGSFSHNETIREYASMLVPGNWLYEVIFVACIIFFAFFYASIIFSPEDVSENLKKSGAFIPSVRPGQHTVDYLYGILNRLTLWGALYIAAICVLPQMVYLYYGAQGFAYVFGGTAILIVVGVTLDTASQIESMVVARNYEAFMSRASKVKGGLGGMLTGQKSRILRR
jgi:preprotein translocase subunit SecY